MKPTALWELFLSGRPDKQDRTRCVIQDESRNMPDGARSDLRLFAVLRPGANDEQIGLPFGGCIDNFPFGPSLSLQTLGSRKEPLPARRISWADAFSVSSISFSCG